MKLKFFLFVPCFILFLNAKSQNLYSSQITGELTDPKRDNVENQLVGQIGTDYITSSTKNGGMTLEVRNQDFKIKVSKECSKITSSITGVQPSSPIILKDKLFLLFTSFNKSSKETTTYIQEIDITNLNATGTAQKLATQKAPETDNKLTMSVGGIGHEGIMKEARQIMIFTLNGVIYSPDRSKALICSSASWNDKTNPDMLSAIVIDESGKLVWENPAVKLTVLSTDFDISKIKLNNNGDIFVSGIEYVNKNTKKTGLDFEHYNHIICISNKGAQVKGINLNEKIGFIYSFDFNFDTQNNIKLAGIYSAKGRGFIDGIFTAEINSESTNLTFTEKNEINFNFTEYGKAKKSDSGTDINKKTKNIDFIIDQIYVHSDGSYSMVAEKVIYTDNHLLGNLRMSYVVNMGLELKDILVARIDPKGKVSWSKLIPKNHTAMTANNGFSYGIAEKNKEIFIVRNDNAENKGKPANEFDNLVVGNDINTLITKISTDGNLEEEILKTSAKKDLKALTISSTSTNEILITHKYFSPANTDDNKYQVSLIKF